MQTNQLTKQIAFFRFDTSHSKTVQYRARFDGAPKGHIEFHVPKTILRELGSDASPKRMVAVYRNSFESLRRTELSQQEDGNSGMTSKLLFARREKCRQKTAGLWYEREYLEEHSIVRTWSIWIPQQMIVGLGLREQLVLQLRFG